jgi:hypothetical protein
MMEWKTGRVTDMAGLVNGKYAGFALKSTFNGNISKWDTSHVTNFRHMFFSAAKFNQDISEWNISSSSDMTSMFEGASMFNIDISSWDASSATKTQNMFRNATSFQDKYTCDDPDSGPSSTCEQSLLSDLTFSDAIQNCLSESPVFGECRMYGRASK